MAQHDVLNQFLTAVANPLSLEKDYDGVPCLEAPRAIVEHFLKTPADLKNFDGPVGYFLYQGVKVYEAGKRREKPKDGVQP